MDLQSFYLAASLQMVVLQGLHFKEDLFMTACVTYFYKLQHDDKNNFNKSSKEWMLMSMFTLASIFVK